MGREELLALLHRLPNWGKIRWPLVALATVAGALLISPVLLSSVPLPQVAPSAQSSKVLASDGQVIATLHGEENRTLVPLEKISKNLRTAVVAAEDRSFFEHRGFSLRGILRAARANWEGGRILQGGSTITQQYVRAAFPNIGTERSFSRKIKETFWAVQLERNSSKEDILERYLNTVYFGRGAYGAEAAARTYFKVSAAELSIGQAAYLAGIMPAPQKYQIDKDPQTALRLRNTVIDQIVALGALKPDQAEVAKAEDLVAQFKPGQTVEASSARAGYFVEYVRQQLYKEFGLSDEQILRGGLQIYTTLDLRMQDAAEAAVKTVLNRDTDPEAALVAMDPEGRVRAMVGGRVVDRVDRARGFNFAVDAQGNGGGRPAGSAFKPFALAAFIEEGKSVQSIYSGSSPVTITSDKCRNADGTPWKVANYGGSGYGYLDVIAATTSSVNTIYAQMMEVVSPDKFIEVARKTGIEVPPRDAGCALTLGTTDVTPMEMAGAYTTFAQRGRRPTPLVVTKITTPQGEVVAQRYPGVTQVMDANVADTVNLVLERNIQSGTGTGAKIGRPAAGKTGTTENFQDAWFAGYTPELTAVVWMGFAPEADGKIPTMTRVRGRSVSGGSFPANIWKSFMSKALEGTKGTGFEDPALGGEIINNQPPPPPPPLFELPFPIIQFPPCFPFCGNNQFQQNFRNNQAENLQRRLQREQERQALN